MRRSRLLIGVGAGLIGGVATKLAGASLATVSLVGWNLGACVFLALTWALLVRAEEAEVRQRAAQEDETQFALLIIIVTAIVASLAAIVMVLVGAKGGHGLERTAAPVLAVLTLVVSWLMLQTIFVVHYAHRHFADRNRDGSDDGGFKFPGEPARTYRDFIYLSLCVGATFQVSDPEVTRSSLRNLVAVHSAIAYFYNTAILALGINIVAGLLGH